MSLPDSPPRYTVEEYLALERSSEERYEFLDGKVYLMAGESPDHGTICTNISGQLYNQLRGKPCQVFSKDMKVRSGPEPKSRYEIKGLYSHPDLVVICGEPQFHDEYRDVLLNPTVIIEVLSPSTEAFDRGEKWLRYQTWLPSLTHYVLVSQARPQLEHYLRQPSGEWLYSSVKELESSLHLAAVDSTLRLAEVYDRIVFSVESVELPKAEGSSQSSPGTETE
jgi:Uma2 family endonuclease